MTYPFDDPYLKLFVEGKGRYYSNHIDTLDKVWNYLTITKGIDESKLDSTLDNPEEYIIEWL